MINPDRRCDLRISGKLSRCDACMRQYSLAPCDGCAVRTDPSSKILRTDRLPRKIDGEVGVDERPFAKIQYRRGAVAEIGGDHRAHRLRYRRGLDQRSWRPSTRSRERSFEAVGH